MISYFDELKLEGEIKGKIEGKIELFRALVDGKFSFCPERLCEKFAQITDGATLDRICTFVAYKAKTLEDVMDFVDEQAKAIS